MRKRISDEVRQDVIRRQGARCQQCGVTVINVFDPAESVIETVLSLERIPIYTYAMTCWKCKQPTHVVTYYLGVERVHTIGDIRKLDFTLMAKYPLVRQHSSRPLEREVVANSCRHCAAHLASVYVAEEMARMIAEGTDLESLVDHTLPNTLSLEDFTLAEPDPDPSEAELARLAHIHHGDGDPANTERDNLVLLCRTCHLAAHLG